jgi:hypothetical protein
MRNAILALVLTATDQEAPVFGQYAAVLENMEQVVAHRSSIVQPKTLWQPGQFTI